MDAVGRIGALATAGFVALVAVAVAGRDGDRDAAGLRTDPAEVVEELVEAWARSRISTYHATGTFSRAGPDGAELSVEIEVAQRPPDRLHRQFGEVTGRRGDRPLECPAPVGDAEPACGLGAPDGGFDAEVADEVAAFRRLVTGPDPLYRVTSAGDDCWRMTRTRPDRRAGFGLEAVVCVHAATGAVRSVAVDHGTIDERTVYDRISPDVADRDLEP